MCLRFLVVSHLESPVTQTYTATHRGAMLSTLTVV